MAKRPDLVIVNGPLAGRRFEVPDGGLRLGRSSSNDIPIPDQELSRNHCLFELEGDDGIRLTDLASANGTYLNNELVGASPVKLKAGDVIEVGQTMLRIGDAADDMTATVRIDRVDRGDGAERVDLGLGTADGDVAAAAGTPEPVRRRSPIANLLWFVVIAVAGAAIYLVLNAPKAKVQADPEPLADGVTPTVREVRYEKVQANESGIFRYLLTLTGKNILTVRIDDVPKEDRHHTKGHPLAQEAMDELNDILAFEQLKQLDREYVGPESEPPVLESYSLKVVYDTRVRTVAVVNTQEPELFRSIREKLEAFSKSELGVWAIQYPREKLVEMAGEALKLAEQRWQDRDVKYGNLAAAIEAYRESIFYLDTINPKPPENAQAIEGLRRATEELDQRYKDQRFQADRALNLKKWSEACEHLSVLLEMVPDTRDDRHRDASAKMMSAEQQLKKKPGKKGGK